MAQKQDDTLFIRLPGTLKQEFFTYCEKLCCNPSALIRRLIELELKKGGKDNA